MPSKEQIPATPGWHEPPRGAKEKPGSDFLATPGWHEPPKAAAEEENSDDDEDGTVQVIEIAKRTGEQAKLLLVKQVAFLKAESKDFGKHLVVCALALGAAAVCGLFLVGYLLSAFSEVFALLVPMWAAQLLVAAVLLVSLCGLALLGWCQFKRAQQTMPDVKGELAKDLQAVKKGLGK